MNILLRYVRVPKAIIKTIGIINCLFINDTITEGE